MKNHSLAQDLREGAIEARGGIGSRAMQVIVAGQIAVTVILLVGAVLFGRSFAALARFDPGFDSDGVLSMRVQMPVVSGAQAAGPAADAQRNDAGAPAMALLEALRGLPGVSQAALVVHPLGGAGAIFYSAEGMGAVDATNRPRAFIQSVSPGYIETIGLRLIEAAPLARPTWHLDQYHRHPGDDAAVLAGAERDRAPHQVWRSHQRQPLADHRWRGEGRELRGIPRIRRATPTFTPFNAAARSFAVLLRTSADPLQLARPAQDVIARRERGTAVFEMQALSELVAQQLAASRFLTWPPGCSQPRRSRSRSSRSTGCSPTPSASARARSACGRRSAPDAASCSDSSSARA